MVALATQANISISIPTQGLDRLRSPQLSGAYSVEGGLRILLAQSGFTFERVGDSAYRIVALRRRTAQRAPQQDSEIIVTAAREPAEPGRIPRSLSHLSSSQLINAGVDSDSELTRLLGGIAFTNLGEGRDKILLRGLSDGALTGRTQSLVGLYFGDTRITYAAPDPDLMLVDISAIDVLRGPQGALYGAGAMGGILRIEPRGVDLGDWSGAVRSRVETTQGGGLGQSLDVVFDAPIVPDRLGLRAVLYDEQTAGWIDNASLNQDDVNHSRRRGARLQVLAQLDSHWSLTATAVLQTIDTKDSQYLALTSAALQRTAHLLEPHDNDFSLYNTTARGDFGWAELTSSTSYLTHEWDNRFDVTGQFAVLGVNPALPRPLDETNALQIVVHETRLSSPVGAPLPWFLGVFYAEGDSTRDTAIRDGAFGIWPDTVYNEHRVDSIDEAAVFGEVTWALAPHLSLASGVRIFYSEVSTQSATTEPLLAMNAIVNEHLKNSGAAPDIRFAYSPNADLLFYVSAAQGFRSGGFNTGGPIGASFGPLQPHARYAGDNVWTFELGSRFNLANGKLRLEAVAFLSDWRDIQTDALHANGFTYSGNVGDARAYGLEFSAHYRPDDHFSLAADALFTEPDITGVSATFPEAAHGVLPGSPEYSASASIRYEDPLPFGTLPWTWSTQFDAHYVGDAKLGFGQGPRVGGYFEIDVSTGVSGSHWRASIYADNLTDAEGPTFSPGNPYQPSLEMETPLRPLTIGVSVQRSF